MTPSDNVELLTVKMKMVSPLLLLVLQLTLKQTSPVMRTVYRRDSPTRHLPEKEQFSPARGTGLEPVREVLLPVRADRSAPEGSAVSVRTSCELNQMLVQVHRSILAPGEPAPRLTLGTCRASRSTRDYVYFQYDVSMCGTTRAVINNQVAYSNTLQYDPLRLQGPIRRAVPFSLSVACHYNRYQYSDYTPKMPVRKSYTSMKTRAKFILTPRNAQWERLSPSDQYALGRSMYFQAEVPTMPRNERLYVHLCYATPENSHTSTPQFPVVQNFGCMVESKDSRSRFVQYKRNAVRFSMDSFYFMGMTNQQLFMHCSMSVGSSVPTPTAKSCNYNTKTRRWVELYGPDSVCTCCDSSCSSAASTVTKIVSSQPWTIDSKMKPSKASERKVSTAAAPKETASEVAEWTTTTTTPPPTTPTPPPGAMPVTLTGKVEATVPEFEWLFGGEGVPWVEMEKQAKGSAVVEEVEEKMEVIEPHTIFDEIFGFD